MIFTHDIYYPVVHRSQEEIEALRKRYEAFVVSPRRELDPLLRSYQERVLPMNYSGLPGIAAAHALVGGRWMILYHS